MSQEYLSENKALLPLSYLPSVDQYCFIVSSCNVLFEVNETFPKQTCRNRAVIYTANGILRLTVPVVKPFGNKTKTSEVLINYQTSWNKIHWRAISSAYNKSPFFLYYKDDFEAIYNNAEGSLVSLNLKLINLINKFLKIKPVIQLTDIFIKDYNTVSEIKVSDQRHCPKDFSKTSFNLPPYSQVFRDKLPFEANLSIIDLLFNEGPHAIEYLRQAKYKTTGNQSE